MIVDVPFEYFCFLAFKVILQFENKRTISLRRLFKYIDELIMLTLENYRNSNDVFSDENWVGNVSIRRMDYYDELLTMVEKSGGIFIFDGDNLQLNEEVTLNNVYNFLDVFNVSSRFVFMSTCTECLEALGATNIKNFILGCVNIEEDFFREYMKLVHSCDNGNIIKRIDMFLLRRLFFISQLSCFNLDTTFAFYTWASNLSNEDFTTDYEKFPINRNLYKQSIFYDNNYDLIDLLQCDFQYAIFGNGNLSKEAITNILWEIYSSCEDSDLYDVDDSVKAIEYEDIIDDIDDLEQFQELESSGLFEFEDNENSDENGLIKHQLDEELVFYLKYIEKINNFFSNYGYNEELNIAKYRLLYILDRPDWCLYDESRFEGVLDKTLENGYLEETIADRFGNAAKYFITEVFGNKNDDSEALIVKKLLFVGCYWDLTHDNEIRDILKAYKGEENYLLFSRIILGDNIGYTKRLQAN